MFKLKPLGSRVLLKRVSEKSKGGILLPDSAKERSSELFVVCCSEVDSSSGDDCVSCIRELKEGARVLLAPYSGVEVNFGGEDLVIVSSKDILGILPS
ncbi:GroES family chaperonin [Candidatus Similichlamydia epinepheli]|uniref:GroES family chaperonin n=1 Tax=Candidatus Similichlamydia epinepheli TaxID=1903953 RepID=UPI000D37A6A8|nr:co-chaperone GroES [Candidatus Similichlamydia epinepheli]